MNDFTKKCYRYIVTIYLKNNNVKVIEYVRVTRSIINALDLKSYFKKNTHLYKLL